MALGNFSNLAEGTLASAINAAATTANLTTGQGAYFPASSFFVVLWDKSYTDPATAYRAAKAEVVLCTSRTTDALTITRAQQGSAAVDFTGLTVGVIHGFTMTDIAELVALIALKSPIASPTFTGTVTTPALNVSGASASTLPVLDASKNLVSGTVGNALILNAGSLSGLGYLLHCYGGGGGISVQNGVTYYFGSDLTVNRAEMTTYNNAKIYIPKAGTIKFIVLKARVTALSTGEAVAHSLRLNDTTDTAIGNAAYSATPIEVTATVSIAVVAGDYIAIKVVCPTWSTPPTVTRWSAILYIE